MHLKIVAAITILLNASCTGNQSQNKLLVQQQESYPMDGTFPEVNSIPVPEGFKRTAQESGSFGNWLRTIPLKKDKTVYLFDGSEKSNQTAQFAVLNISVGNKDLQQCADAIMRLRAEYLFAQKDFDKISFTDNEGGVYKLEAPFTRAMFAAYLQRVFGMCGSASLSKQLLPVGMMDMKVGDVLIKGGFPGHAVIVMDMATNAAGEKVYLLAQSYMPAQDIHILKNTNDENLSPWYELNNDEDIFTPEYHFTNRQLKTW